MPGARTRRRTGRRALGSATACALLVAGASPPAQAMPQPAGGPDRPGPSAQPLPVAPRHHLTEALPDHLAEPPTPRPGTTYVLPEVDPAVPGPLPIPEVDPARPGPVPVPEVAPVDPPAGSLLPAAPPTAALRDRR